MSSLATSFGIDSVLNRVRSGSERDIPSESAKACSTGAELIKRQIENEVVTNLCTVTESVRGAVPRISKSTEKLRAIHKYLEVAKLKGEGSREFLAEANTASQDLINTLSKEVSEFSDIIKAVKRKE